MFHCGGRKRISVTVREEENICHCVGRKRISVTVREKRIPYLSLLG